MASSVPRQIQSAVRRQRSDSPSARNDGRTTERITVRTVAKSKRRLQTKPAKRPVRAKKAAAEKHKDAAVAGPPSTVPFQQIVVGEREGEPNYRNPGQPSSQAENRQQGDDAPREHPSALADAQQPGPSTDANHRNVVEEPPFRVVPGPLPEGVPRPSIARLQEILFAIDDICEYDGHIQSEVADIENLIMEIRHREAEVARKVRNVQRTRITVEKLYASRVRVDPWLIGQGKRRSESERESEREREREEQPEVAEDQLRRKRIANGKRRADDSAASLADDEEARPRAKRGRSQ
ncbi:hypothetical protein GSI_04043 [Ganoderma sinense ZZ0214-1]|uniref:Uncharacterized protein n=1 Tax=Ganoderma sinense ZZ0214-1 TaxID=1077348 RepID=A0A2G8SI41_9APHY|nr:hypothetical protein GSI_04043 [Ganoderma sinense ZZ0214-1]